MEMIYFFSVLWFMSAIALGVGSSSLAIVSFLVALKDGGIDQSERRMLGVIYWSLRWSMILIAVILFLFTFVFPDTVESLSHHWVMLAILAGNAILMTKHWIPVQIGPALQAATWYTIGFVVSIELFSLVTLTPFVFGVLYLVDVLIAIILVNVLLRFCK